MVLLRSHVRKILTVNKTFPGEIRDLPKNKILGVEWGRGKGKEERSYWRVPYLPASPLDCRAIARISLCSPRLTARSGSAPGPVIFSLKPSTYGKEILERFISDKMPPAVSGCVAWCKTIRLVVIRIAVNSLFILFSRGIPKTVRARR